MFVEEDDLQDWFKALPDRLAKDLAATVKAQADRLAAAQRQALVRLEKPPEESGGLLASIGVDPGKNDVSFVVRAGGEPTTRGGYDHALAFEFGTRRQPARSFFYSTARAMSKDINKEIEQAVTNAVYGS